jgi:hypothetical protein
MVQWRILFPSTMALENGLFQTSGDNFNSSIVPALLN